MEKSTSSTTLGGTLPPNVGIITCFEAERVREGIGRVSVVLPGQESPLAIEVSLHVDSRYPHDASIALQTLADAYRHIPIPYLIRCLVMPYAFPPADVKTFFLPHRGCNPVNEKISASVITLSAGQMPPHKAVTKTLVAREYARTVLRYWRLQHPANAPAPFFEEYLKLRNIRPDLTVTGFHTDPKELLIDDLRLLFFGVEPGYWPHPNFVYPTKVPGLLAFLQNVVRTHHV